MLLCFTLLLDLCFCTFHTRILSKSNHTCSFGFLNVDLCWVPEFLKCNLKIPETFCCAQTECYTVMCMLQVQAVTFFGQYSKLYQMIIIST